MVALATQAEVDAGTDVRKVITPKTLADNTILPKEGEMRVVSLTSGMVMPAQVATDTPFVAEVTSVDEDGLKVTALTASPNFPVLFVNQGNLPTATTLAADQAVNVLGLVGPIFIDQLRLHPASAGADNRFAANDVFYLKSTSPSPTDPFQKDSTAYPAGRVVDASNAASGLYDVLFNPLVSPAGQNAVTLTTDETSTRSITAALTIPPFRGSVGLIVYVFSGEGGESVSGETSPAGAGGGSQFEVHIPSSLMATYSTGGGAAGTGGNEGLQSVRKATLPGVNLDTVRATWSVGAGGRGAVPGGQAGQAGRIEIYPLYPS